MSSHDLDLEQQRKRAKDLRRAHARGSTDAAERVAAHLPRARGKSAPEILATRLALTEAQLVIAREAGFESWPKLKHALELANDADRIELAIDAALAGKPAGETGLHLACALGDARVIAQLTPELAQARVGRRAWTLLLYTCCSRYGRGDPSILANRISIAKKLLDLGADPNARGRETWFSTKAVDGFDVEDWVPLLGATSRVASPELMQQLVDAGARGDRTSGLLNHAVLVGDLRVLEVALGAKPAWWQFIWGLLACADFDRAAHARLLIPHATSPFVPSKALERAMREERGIELVEILLGTFPPSEQRRAIEDSIHRAARRYGRHDAAALLRSRGASDAVLSPADLAIANAIDGVPAAPVTLRDDDHRMLSWAITKRHYDAVPRLLALGCDPNVHDIDGELPLHHARRANAAHVMELLVAAGARDDKSFDDAAPDDPTQFERAADAVAAGDLQALREMLDDDPDLVHARSPRPHRATLFIYSAANGTEGERQRTPKNAHEVAELLLERGSDPNATCRMYETCSDAMGLMLTSAHPNEAKLDGELVRVYVKYGARIDRSTLDTPISYGMPRSVTALVDAGLPIDLYVAAALDRLDLVERELAAGVDVNTRFADNSTALHAAATMGHERIVRFLLERGADRTIVETRWGNTPADSARHFERAEIVALLE